MFCLTSFEIKTGLTGSALYDNWNCSLLKDRTGSSVLRSGTGASRLADLIDTAVMTLVGYDTIRYDVYGVASLVHHTSGQTEKLRKRTKNKSKSMISPVQSRDRESSPG